MAWFSRKNKDDEAGREDSRPARSDGEAEASLQQAGEVGTARPDTSDIQEQPAGDADAAQERRGPWDEAEKPELEERLDAGALRVPVVPGATLQFSTDAARSQILGVVYLKDQSALQLQVYAAPRSGEVWNQVRLDMRTSIAGQGGSSQEAEGLFGTELRAQMPVPESKGYAPFRFIGIEGPRWLLRVNMYGRAGSDDSAAEDLLKILDDVVVVRGADPHPPLELLPLSIPRQLRVPQAPQA